MEKLAGFMEYRREVPTNKDPLERIKDWDEFQLRMSEDEVQTQGSRCMDCGIPFCHTGGLLISSMATGCPINNLIPEWNDLVFQGLWHEALERLHRTNNFPEFTGRVCPAPCESSCTLGDNHAVTIKNIELSIIEHGWMQGWITPCVPKVRTGKKVAIIGSGPTGLAAAAQLNKVGHSVTVFERAELPGGLLMYGIPNMKLDKKEVVLRRIKLLEAEGITFICNASIGSNAFPVAKLRKEFDAIILATGATVPRDLPIEGRSLTGIHFAVDFLSDNTKAILNSTSEYTLAKDKDVVIIGGGDTGTDCVATALRHGCHSVVQLEIMSRSPLSRAADNPWPERPKIHKVDYGHEEATAKFGTDPRTYLTTATKFEGDDEGNVVSVHTVEVSWGKNDKGQVVPIPVSGTEQVRPAGLVLLAMGFVGPETSLLDALALERDSRGNAKAEFEKYTTNISGVFAAGDCRRGQSLIVWAINEGRGVARECDRFLMGKTELP